MPSTTYMTKTKTAFLVKMFLHDNVGYSNNVIELVNNYLAPPMCLGYLMNNQNCIYRSKICGFCTYHYNTIILQDGKYRWNTCSICRVLIPKAMPKGTELLYNMKKENNKVIFNWGAISLPTKETCKSCPVPPKKISKETPTYESVYSTYGLDALRRVTKFSITLCIQCYNNLSKEEKEKYTTKYREDLQKMFISNNIHGPGYSTVSYYV